MRANEINGNVFEDILSGVHRETIKKIDLREEYLGIRELERLKDAVRSNSSVGHIYWGGFPEGDRAKNLIKAIEAKIIHNNKNFKHYPKDYVYGLLSSFTYNTSKEGNEVKLNDVSKDRHLKGWKVHKVTNDKGNSGYYGAIYIHEAMKHLVLAHRGTDFTVRELLSRDSGFREDLRGVLGGKIVAQQAIAYVITKEAADYAREKGYTFSITGHSLGAWLAEFSAILCHLEFEHYDVKAVTFDSPGALPLLKKFKSNVRNSDTELNASNIDITTYLSAPNIVNSCNGHVGNAYRLFPRLEMPRWLSMMPAAKKFHSVVGHLLSTILDEFDPNTGVPRKYERVMDWPSMRYKKEQSQGGVINVAAESAKSMFVPKFGQRAFDFAMRGVKKLVGDHTLTSVVDVLSDFVSGNIDISQYWDLFNYINYQESLSARTNLSGQQRFYLGYKNHFRTKVINHYEQLVVKNNHREEEIYKYISQLKKYERGLLVSENLSELIKEQLRDTIRLCRLERKHGRLYIMTNGEITVDALKERVMRIINLLPEIEETINEIRVGSRNSSPVTLHDINRSEGNISFVNSGRQNVQLRELDEVSEDGPEVVAGLRSLRLSHSFESLFMGSVEELELLKTSRIYFDYESSGGMTIMYLDIEPDIKRLFNEKHFDYDGENKLEWLRELLERNPEAIKNARLVKRTGGQITSSNITLNFPALSDDILINYISEWIKYGFGKAVKPGAYHTNLNIINVDFNSLFRGQREDLEQLRSARIYFKYEENDTEKTLYLDIKQHDLEKLFNENHFDYYGQNKLQWLRNLLQTDPQAIKDAYLTNSEGWPIEVSNVVFNTPTSNDSLINYISEWIGYATVAHQKPLSFGEDRSSQERVRAARELQFADYFRGPKEDLRKLQEYEIHFFYRIGNNTSNYLYLNIHPDLERLFNEGHFDYYGQNKLQWLREKLTNDPGLIQRIEIKNRGNEEARLNLITTNFPRNIEDPVIGYICDWIKYGFDNSRSMPGEFNERYQSAANSERNREHLRRSISPSQIREQRETRDSSRGI